MAAISLDRSKRCDGRVGWLNYVMNNELEMAKNGRGLVTARYKYISGQATAGNSLCLLLLYHL